MGTAAPQGLKPSFGIIWLLSLPAHPIYQANPIGCKLPQVHPFSMVQPITKGSIWGYPLPGLSAFALIPFVLCPPASCSLHLSCAKGSSDLSQHKMQTAHKAQEVLRQGIYKRILNQIPPLLGLSGSRAQNGFYTFKWLGREENSREYFSDT